MAIEFNPQRRYRIDYDKFDVVELASLYGVLTRAQTTARVNSVRQDFTSAEHDKYSALWSDAQTEAWDVIETIARKCGQPLKFTSFAYATNFMSGLVVEPTTNV